MIQPVKIIAALLLIISYSSLTQAQSDEVYLTSGDTITGKIQIPLPSEFYEEITIKADGEKRRFKSFQLLGFKTEKANYRIIKFGTKYRIMEELMKGYLGLYKFRAGDNYEFSSRFLYKATNEGMEVPNITFRQSVTKFLDECPTVQEEIKNKMYRSSNLEEMVTAFNNCLDDIPQFAEEEEEKKKSKKSKDSKPASKEYKLIQSITQKLRSEDIDEELITLLSDLKDKILKGEKVPSYLKSALQEATANYNSVGKEVSELLKMLGN
ncbi:MAG: hypothetical protein AAGF85_10790 [Bacteroidota bacterium]